jgi:hypothetical protein
VTISTLRGTFVFAPAVVAILSGCGGGQSLGNDLVPPNSRLSASVQPGTVLNGEMLSSTKVRSNCHRSGYAVGSFQAVGTARGPLSGTFLTRGRIFSAPLAYVLASSFTIDAGSRKIIGRVFGQLDRHDVECANGKLTFILSGLNYSIRHGGSGSAAAALNRQGHFTESFQ